MASSKDELSDQSLGLPDLSEGAESSNTGGEVSFDLGYNEALSVPAAAPPKNNLTAGSTTDAVVPSPVVADLSRSPAPAPIGNPYANAVPVVAPAKPTAAPAKPAAIKPAPSTKPAPTAAAAATAKATPVAPTPAATAPEGDLVIGHKKGVLDWMTHAWNGTPAWLISLLFHVAILLALAAYQIEHITEAIGSLVVSANPTDDGDVDAMEDFSIDAPANIDVPQESSDVVPDATSIMSNVVTNTSVDVKLDSVPVPNMAGLAMPSMSSDALSSAVMSATSGAGQISKALNSRSKAAKRELLNKYGGNEDTERSVSMALKWLATHQRADGAWTFAHSTVCNGQCKEMGSATDATNAATGIALMAFLGAGQTHLEGEYKKQVFNGLSYLLKNMKPSVGEMPSWYINQPDRREAVGSMYNHAIPSIAICEAYGMSKDPILADAAQYAINFIAYAQTPASGGWDYVPRSGLGDTSIVGWNLMALKSAAMSGLKFNPQTIVKAQGFLDSVSNSDGSRYGYRKPDEGGPAMTPCGLLCRMYMGLPKDNAGLQKATQALAKNGPIPNNIYYNYYATQVMKQVGGQQWEDWNTKMKNHLLPSQVQAGHGAGSWNVNDGLGNGGGRLYYTAMSAMILEVYYRYLPIYGEQAEDEAFKL